MIEYSPFTDDRTTTHARDYYASLAPVWARVNAEGAAWVDATFPPPLQRDGWWYRWMQFDGWCYRWHVDSEAEFAAWDAPARVRAAIRQTIRRDVAARVEA